MREEHACFSSHTTGHAALWQQVCRGFPQPGDSLWYQLGVRWLSSTLTVTDLPQTPQLKGSVSQDPSPTNANRRLQALMFPITLIQLGYRLEVPTTSHLWAYLLDDLIGLRETHVRVHFIIKGMIKDTGDQPDEETHRIRSIGPWVWEVPSLGSWDVTSQDMDEFTNQTALWTSLYWHFYGDFITFFVVQLLSCIDSLQPYGLQYTRLPCPSLSPRVCSNSCPLIGDGIQPSHPLSSPLLLPSTFPASGSFPMSWFFTTGGQNIGVSASVLSVNIQGWFPLGLSGLISLLSKGLPSVFSSPTVWKGFIT